MGSANSGWNVPYAVLMLCTICQTLFVICTYAKDKKYTIFQRYSFTSFFFLRLLPPHDHPTPPTTKNRPTSHASLHTHAPATPNLSHSLTQRLAHFPTPHHTHEPPFHHLILLLLGFAVPVRGDEGVGRGPAFLDRNGFVAREASGCHCGIARVISFWIFWVCRFCDIK